MTTTRTVQGSLRDDQGRGTVHLEARTDAPPEEVWAALTHRQRLAAWLGPVEGEPELLSATFTATGWEGGLVVEACEPQQRLLVGTRSEGEPDCVIEVLLQADDAGTHVVVEDRGLPLDQLWAYGGGDQVLLEGLLAHLAGRPLPEARSRWQELGPGYRELGARL